MMLEHIQDRGICRGEAGDGSGGEAIEPPGVVAQDALAGESRVLGVEIAVGHQLGQDGAEYVPGGVGAQPVQLRDARSVGAVQELGRRRDAKAARVMARNSAVDRNGIA
jgi:hypothetical protein